ncbi:MAG: hypothetical protein ACK40L_06680, partial [Hydrogenophaga sp.]
MNTTTATRTIELKKGDKGTGLEPGYLARRDIWDWLFAAFVVAGGAVALFAPALPRDEPREGGGGDTATAAAAAVAAAAGTDAAPSEPANMEL